MRVNPKPPKAPKSLSSRLDSKDSVMPHLSEQLSSVDQKNGKEKTGTTLFPGSQTYMCDF